MDFLHDEEAQATTEYILILAVLVTLAILVVRDLIKPAMKFTTDHLTDAINTKLFKEGGSMHQSPFKH